MNDRLISADAFQRTASERNWDGKITDYQLALVNYLLSIQPTVDAVPVVRCKDCIYSVPAIIDGLLKCELLLMTFFDDDFCSMGERREDASKTD